MKLDLVEGLEQLDQQLAKLTPTPTQKKKMTKAGALVYKEALKVNLNQSLHKGPNSRSTPIKLDKDIGVSYRENDGATYVGFKNSLSNEHGYITRLLNDGYMGHGGKGSKSHSTKYIPGLHFQERTVNEVRLQVLAAEAKEYKEMTNL